MARDDDWNNEERRWNDYREAQRRADRSGYGYDDRRYAYGDDNEPRVGYRAAREDLWFETRRREREEEARRRAERGGHVYRPFGDTGPTAYGPYDESAYAWRPSPTPYGVAAPYAGMGGYGGAKSTYEPRYETGRFGMPPADGRAGEPRSFIDKAADQVASWFGDNGAERRRREDDLERARHRGRGPKGYKRADARIQEDINDRLTEDPYLDATDIEVTVSEGNVTLHGVVISREDKRRAERLAEEVSGVGDVQNNLRLRRSGLPDEAVETPPGGAM